MATSPAAWPRSCNARASITSVFCAGKTALREARSRHSRKGNGEPCRRVLPRVVGSRMHALSDRYEMPVFSFSYLLLSAPFAASPCAIAPHFVGIGNTSTHAEAHRLTEFSRVLRHPTHRNDECSFLSGSLVSQSFLEKEMHSHSISLVNRLCKCPFIDNKAIRIVYDV